MELLLSRSQKTGKMGFGGISFVLNVRSKLTSQEQEYVGKYKLGNTIIYENASVTERMAESGAFKQLATAVAARATGRMFTVNDLVNGKTVECKDVVELLEAEAQIKDAADAFYMILTACAEFGGEEVIQYPREE